MDRRRFLDGLGAAAMMLPLESVLRPLAEGDAASPFSRFAPIAPSDADDLVLPEGFVYDVVLKWGDPFTAGGELFGYNNDFIGVCPLGSDEEALLVVNHEYISLAFAGDCALYPQTFEVLRGRRPTVDDYKRDVGLSVVRVRRDSASGVWVPVLKDPLNRRIDAFTQCRVDGPAAALMGQELLEGTFDNCAGQVTPWRTVLSCEENFQARVPELVDGRGRYSRGGSFDLPGGHYGWVVEVDPYDPGSKPVKHTALGRFRHENVGLRVEPGRPVAGYMGDDRIGGHIWKFLSNGLYRADDPAGSRGLLSSGTLLAARFNRDGSGEWRPLDLDTPLEPNRHEADTKPFIPPRARRLGDCYATLGAALLDAYQAANAIGASPAGRPEDLEVHRDGSVYIAFTSLASDPLMWGNRYGEIWRLEEDRGDVRSRRFRWTRFAPGGPNDATRAGHVFAQPDNLLFDAQGDLWASCDLASLVINHHPDFLVYRNSGVFRVPCAGAHRGHPGQFASMPCEAEPTGPAFAPREQALFLSVQHPGERWGMRTEAGAGPRGSNWPHGRLGAPPQPAVVAIRPR
jgi:uncharacterized protein